MALYLISNELVIDRKLNSFAHKEFVSFRENKNIIQIHNKYPTIPIFFEIPSLFLDMFSKMMLL